MWDQAEPEQGPDRQTFPPEESLLLASTGRAQGQAQMSISSYSAPWPLRAQAPLAGS